MSNILEPGARRAPALIAGYVEFRRKPHDRRGNVAPRSDEKTLQELVVMGLQHQESQDCVQRLMIEPGRMADLMRERAAERSGQERDYFLWLAAEWEETAV